jgi:hypothetical protein
VSPHSTNLQGALIAKYATGRLENRESERLAVLPFASIAAIVSAAPAETQRVLTQAFARAFAQSAEQQVQQVLASPLADASAEQVAYAINIAFAKAGLGQIQFERWGQALTVRWTHPPGTQTTLADFSVYVLQFVLQNTALAEAHIATLSVDDHSLWLLIASAASCARVSIERQSQSPVALLARLQATEDGVNPS